MRKKTLKPLKMPGIRLRNSICVCGLQQQDKQLQPTHFRQLV